MVSSPVNCDQLQQAPEDSKWLAVIGKTKWQMTANLNWRGNSKSSFCVVICSKEELILMQISCFM